MDGGAISGRSITCGVPLNPHLSGNEGGTRGRYKLTTTHRVCQQMFLINIYYLIMAASSLEYKPLRLSENVTLQTPLSRFGKGPGLLLLVSKDYKSRSSTDITKTLDPEPQQKWAEEGFAVIEVKVDSATIEEDFKTGIEALKKLPESGSYSTVGVIGNLSRFFRANN